MSQLFSDNYVLNTIAALSGKKVKGQQICPPHFHPFPARMPTPIADYLVEHLSNPNDVILDPMCGSGTTLIAAGHQGRKAVGIDRDPLACRISRVATTCFQKQRLEEVRDYLLTDARSRFRSESLRELRKSYEEEERAFMRFWYPWQSEKELFALKGSLEQLPPGVERDFAWLAFSGLIISKSSSVSWARDIAHSRPHRDLSRTPPRPFAVWIKRFDLMTRRLPFLNRSNSTKIGVCQGDARQLGLPDESVDFVLSSPPYHNAIDYLRSSKFSLLWMDYALEELRELRGTMVGAERGMWEQNGLPATVESRLGQMEQLRRRAITRRYLSEMGLVFGELARVLRKGRLAILFVGPTLINSARTDAATTFGTIAESKGLSLIGSVCRRVASDRRSLPFPKDTDGHDSLARRMSREVILAFRRK